MLAAEVKRQGMPAVGITDHGNMFGSDAFYQKWWRRGLNRLSVLRHTWRRNRGSIRIVFGGASRIRNQMMSQHQVLIYTKP